MNPLKAEIEKAAKNKLFDFFTGLNLYAQAEITKWQPAAKVIWREGSTRILDYGGKGKKILILAPHINRANILDLSNGKSLMHFLKGRGYHPLLVDWGSAGAAEKNFDSDSYVTRLMKFCGQEKDLIIGGYCMGGLLALKLATRIKPKALILLATPWDFHAPDVKRVEIAAAAMEKLLDTQEYIPPQFIQALFLTADHWRVYNKYSAFPEISAAQRAEMMEVESWVNDGVAMSVPLAKECIIDWAIKNSTGKNRWLKLDALKMPVFLGVPRHDRIVPLGCSLPLAGLLKGVHVEKFPCGHIGMLTKKLCFAPLANWLKRIS